MFGNSHIHAAVLADIQHQPADGVVKGAEAKPFHEPCQVRVPQIFGTVFEHLRAREDPPERKSLGYSYELLI